MVWCIVKGQAQESSRLVKVFGDEGENVNERLNEKIGVSLVSPEKKKILPLQKHHLNEFEKTGTFCHLNSLRIGLLLHCSFVSFF